jgi:hypothetical protein
LTPCVKKDLCISGRIIKMQFQGAQMVSRCLFSIVLFAMVSNAVTLCDSSFAFRVQTEYSWTAEKIDTLTHCLSNSSTKTQIFIERIQVDTFSFLTEREKAQVYFLSNYVVAKQTGMVQYFDSTKNVLQSGLPAYEMFAYYKGVDDKASIWWAEISRWCCKDNIVFQLTVLGDTADVKKNYTTYNSLLKSIDVWIPSEAPTPTNTYKKNIAPVAMKSFSNKEIYSLDGRRISPFILRTGMQNKPIAAREKIWLTIK